jgi:hypothetical protein
MSGTTDNPYNLPLRANGLPRLFPSHHGDFSNLEELKDLFGGSVPPRVMTGKTVEMPKDGGERVVRPHAIVYLPDSPQSFEFIKIDEDEYVLKIHLTGPQS